jgi:hypothetical protein
MYFGTRCSGGVLVTLGAATIAGAAAGAGAMGTGRTVEVVIGVDGFDGVTRVGVDDERLEVVDVMESVGSCDVGVAAGSTGDRFEPAFAEPLAPAQPATTIERTAAPTRERAAYQRACLTTTHASE